MEERSEFQKRFDDLSQENIKGIVSELNKVIGDYIGKGGLSVDPNNNPDYNKIIELTKRIESIKQKYVELNDDILLFLSSESKDNDLSGLLKENGEIQKQINRLEKIEKEINVDVTSAIARDELLRSRNTEISRHSLFILDRPIREKLVPYLWVFSVLFIGIGLLIFRHTFPQLSISVVDPGTVTSSIYMNVFNFISNKAVLISLLISAIIVILFLSLKIAGVFGK